MTAYLKKNAPFICFLGGAATGLCLICAKLGPAVFVLITVPIVALLREKNAGRAFRLCALFCIGLCAANYMTAFSIQPNAEPHAVFWIDLLLYLGACIIHGTVLTLGMWCGLRIPCPEILRPAALALGWTLGEWLCGVGPLAWPTLRLGLAMWRYPMLIQSASLFGLLFISALVIFVNTLLAKMLCRILDKDRRAVLSAAAALILFTGNAAFGILSLEKSALAESALGELVLAESALAESALEKSALAESALGKLTSGKSLTVAAVQPGETAIGEQEGEKYEKTLQLARQTVQRKADFVLMPENAVTAAFYYDGVLQKQWRDIAYEGKSDLLVCGPYVIIHDRATGAVLSPAELTASKPEEKLTNGELRYRRYTRSAAYLFESDRMQEKFYLKQREVPLFERGQGDGLFGIIQSEPSGLMVGTNVKAGVLICYESLFADMARRLVSEGAEILAVPTNDSWFSADAAKEIHLAHGIFRAVETGCPLIQAGWNGYTAVVDAYGRITAELSTEKAEVLYGEVCIERRNTLYLLWGDFWLIPYIILIGIFIAAKLIFNRKKMYGEEKS